MMDVLQTAERRLERYNGASPAENRFYTLIMFDISDKKKYSTLTKLLKRYSCRIQNSVYEAYLRPLDIKRLIEGIEKLMESKRFFDPADKVRVYRMSGACSVTVFGECTDDDEDLQTNIFI